MKKKTRFEELVEEVLKTRPGCAFKVTGGGKEIRVLAPTIRGGQTEISIDLAALGETPEVYMEKMIAEDRAQVCPKCGKPADFFKTSQAVLDFQRGAGCQECQDKVDRGFNTSLLEHSVESDMDHFKDKISKDLFGRTRAECVAKKMCVGCGSDASKFRDDESVREYKISGFCQKCQDDVFDG